MTAEDRIEHLRRMIDAAKKKDMPITFPVRWRDDDIPLHIIRVDVRFLRYRLENGRTREMQLEYLEDHKDQPQDLFKDPESKAAQDAQDSILRKIIKEQGLEKDLVDEGQREPAIITYDGFVLNGNRRLAALRANKLQYMNCVVLPEDSTRKDLYRLELDLQMAKDTKMPYRWVAELLHIKYGINDIREGEDDLAKAMRITPNDLRKKERMLEYVDWFLEWCETPRQYHKVGQAEQAFRQIEKHATAMKTNQKKRKDFCLEAFTLVKNKPDETRLYEHINTLAKNFEDVQTKISTTTKKGPKPGLSEQPKTKKDVESGSERRSTDKDQSSKNLLEALADADDGKSGGSESGSCTDMFSSPENAAESAPFLVGAIADAREKSRERKVRT